MIDRKIGSLPVMENDKLVGIITETDLFKAFVNVLGGYVEGIRLTIELPDKPGQLAKIAEDIAAANGNILAVTTTNINRDETSEVTIKETGADENALKERLAAHDIKIVDMRSNISYSPAEYGK
jgi:acetoin utilization protein AcuB